MLNSKEEINIPSEHLFSLQPINQQNHKLEVRCDFSPIQCRKTYKLIRTIPKYQGDLEECFQSEAGRLMHSQSMKSLRKETPSCIMVAKPSSHFCQVCKQSFDDYLKHITHPLHQRRQKETEKSFSLDSLKEILQIKRSKNKKITWMNQDQPQQEDTHSATSLQTSQVKSNGSKKRIVLREGQMEPVSVASSTKCEEEDIFEEVRPTPQRRLHRKYSNFRNTVHHQP